MTLSFSVPKVWKILDQFKAHCQSRGWRTSAYEDWVRMNNEYHNFLWIRTIYPSTFYKIAMKQQCAIREGDAYQVVETAYTAWLFPAPPSADLVNTVTRTDELARRTALFDLSSAHLTQPICRKLNRTGSVVFKEFEGFLQDACHVEVKPLPIPK